VLTEAPQCCAARSHVHGLAGRPNHALALPTRLAKEMISAGATCHQEIAKAVAVDAVFAVAVAVS